MDPQLWKKAEQIFIACADMLGKERQAYLDSACHGDEELRRAVEGMLRGDQQEDAMRDVIGCAASTIAETNSDRLNGMQVGAYTIESRIAEGGMGAVYLARRSDQQFEQEVAIKLLPGALATDELRARFIAERQILANLNHNNIAKLVDGGETDDGVPYLVMEYIDGAPIDEYCDRQRLSVQDRIALFTKVCSAVHYAHQNLVIHRDIKPSNILVAGDGQPKLLDFGIAKLLDPQSLPRGAALTMDGSRLLTPRHASPEQILGERITTASDVYSLGLLFYELLCGHFPYQVDDTGRASEMEKTITEHVPSTPSSRVPSSAKQSETISRLRRTSPTNLKKQLHGDLDTIVMKALHKEPEGRYDTAQAFADDLQRFMQDLPIIARPPTPAYVLSRYWMRHRTAAIGIVATIITLLAGAVATTIGFIHAKEAEGVALEEAQKAETIAEFLASILKEADPNESAGQKRSVDEILGIGLERVDAELDDSPTLKAGVLELMSGIYKARADYPLAEDLLQRALAVHEAAAPEDLAVRARLLNDIGDLARIQGRDDEATDYIERALDLHARIGGDVTQAHADAVNNIALLYDRAGRYEDAEEMFDKAYRLRQELYDTPHPMIALSLHNLAWYHEGQDNFEAAEDYANQAIAMREAVFGEIHPRVAMTTAMLSRIYRTQGKLDDAEREATKAVSIAEQIFDSGHPDLAYTMQQLAKVMHAKGDLHAAATTLAQVVEWDRVSETPFDLVVSLFDYTSVLIDLGDFEQAEPLLLEAREIIMSASTINAAALDRVDTLLTEVRSALSEDM